MYHTVAGIMFIQPGGQFLKIGVISLTVSAFVANILPIIEGYGNKNSGQKRISPAFGLTVTGAQFFNNSGQIQIGILEQYQQVIEQIR